METKLCFHTKFTIIIALALLSLLAQLMYGITQPITTKSLFIMLTSLVGVSVLGAGWLYIKKFSASIYKLTEAFGKLKRGDFNITLNNYADDEIGNIAKNFNELVQILKNVDTQRTQLDNAKTEFLSITSHELRSPMTPMKAHLQMILEGYYGKINKEQKEALNIIIKNTNHLDTIIADFLEISRIEAARLKFKFVKTDITLIIQAVVEEMKNFIPEKNIHIKTELTHIPLFDFDPERISQVLRNLINNAIKFSKPNASIIVRTKKQENHVLVSVQDFGVGIAKENRKRVFEPFFQEDTTLQRERTGTGLGLTICRGIVQSQNGRIWIEGEKGAGSIFYFTVPFTPVKEQKPITLIFSEQHTREERVRAIFRDALGILGDDEVNSIQKKGAINEQSISAHIRELETMHVFTRKQSALLQKQVKAVFS
ncbi:hypothetical protein COT72_02925 [archaeon CG10_big_fil_rev_8_21_14_0_10_43_11]|nr:MAG: hypothetical protein COT72_02925 [archaeon CG10_big_fil_rev_8_21_14_0_10_43_11]